MEGLYERIIALLIDAFIIMSIGYPIFWIVAHVLNITSDSDYYYWIVNVYFALLYSCKDLLFRNASIGKKFINSYCTIRIIVVINE